MKATTRRRFTAFVVAMVSGFSTLSVANAAALEIQNNSVTDAGTQATQAQETIDFTHTFRIGNQGFYFKVYDMNGIEISHDEFVDDEKECTLVRFYKTEADTKQLDLLQAYEFECGHVDSWSYRGFEYDNIGISEISPAVSDEIMKSIIHITTLTEEEKSMYDFFKDGQIDVRDVIFANQIITGYLNTYTYGWVKTFPSAPMIDFYEEFYISGFSKTSDGSLSSVIKPGENVIPDSLKYEYESYASKNGIDSYGFHKSSEPIMYSYALTKVQVDEDGNEYRDFVQILPKEYCTLLMSDFEYRANLDYETMPNEEDYDYVEWHVRFNGCCIYNHPTIHFPRKFDEANYEDWYMVPRENFEDVYKIAGGSEKLEQLLKEDYDLMLFKESSSETESVSNVEANEEPNITANVDISNVSYVFENFSTRITKFFSNLRSVLTILK